MTAPSDWMTSSTAELPLLPSSVGPSPARRAAEAVVQTLSAPRLSLEALRLAVVRYGRLARELALGPDEMLGTLVPAVRHSLATRPDVAPHAELESWVEWWAIHGYHRAD
jgi:hypothetical protein